MQVGVSGCCRGRTVQCTRVFRQQGPPVAPALPPASFDRTAAGSAAWQRRRCHLRGPFATVSRCCVPQAFVCAMLLDAGQGMRMGNVWVCPQPFLFFLKPGLRNAPPQWLAHYQRPLAGKRWQLVATDSADHIKVERTAGGWRTFAGGRRWLPDSRVCCALHIRGRPVGPYAQLWQSIFSLYKRPLHTERLGCGRDGQSCSETGSMAPAF
jgi:hypothetical protein|mmetsp:Transcript_7550/g.14347  ORF Transcript_7550/g.14347 Transcript_7550/m.14347 type:complete len:210 (+) Transcript_7550:288-917(+)